MIRLAALAVLLPLAFPLASSAAPPVRPYPGIYPALTASYASVVGREAPRRAWLRDPRRVAQAFARATGWPAAQRIQPSLRRGNSRATVELRRAGLGGASLVVELVRWAGAWEVTGCRTASLRITRPRSGGAMRSPARVEGVVKAFEGVFDVAVLGAGWRSLGRVHSQTAGMRPAHFAVRLPFRSRGGPMVVEVSTRSPKDGSLLDLAMVKVIPAR